MAGDRGTVRGPTQTASTIAPIDPIACEGPDPKFALLWGALDERDGWPAKILKNGNDSSVVAQLRFGKTSFLFPGDWKRMCSSLL